MLDWKKHKLESRLLGEISITSGMHMTILMAESEEELKGFLMKVKEESEKAGLKLNNQKRKIMASSPIMSWQINVKNFPQLVVIHTVKGFGKVKKAEIDIFLELSCFFDDPADVGNLISSSSAFSKTSLNIRKFTVHVLLKPGLENFEHYFTSV